MEGIHKKQVKNQGSGDKKKSSQPKKPGKTRKNQKLKGLKSTWHMIFHKIRAPDTNGFRYIFLPNG